MRFTMAINGAKLLEPTTVELLQTSQRLNSGPHCGITAAEISNISYADTFVLAVKIGQ